LGWMKATKRRTAPKMMGNTTARPAIRAFITAGAPTRTPARKWWAMGRIEHTLLVREFSVRPNRPKTFARTPTLYHKK